MYPIQDSELAKLLLWKLQEAEEILIDHPEPVNAFAVAIWTSELIAWCRNLNLGFNIRSTIYNSARRQKGR
ncbi:unnamed protein product [Calypogeia fissa]